MGISVLIAGLVTGLLLGVLGSGGSIITVPALLYLLQVEPKSAIAMSLGIVAVTATITALNHWRRGNVNLKVTAVFGLFGFLGTFAGTRLGVITPVALQLGLFALVMYAAAYRMLRSSKPTVHKSLGAAAVSDVAVAGPEMRMGKIAVHGLAVGMLTGVVGVGGGFLIVPALVLLSGLTMKQAIGTSLSIVAVNSFTGFTGYTGLVQINYLLMGIFTAVAVGGSFLGAMLSNRLSGEMLKRGFAVFLVLVATYILLKSVF
ncbi:MAG: sulfite exporter TauE/SafE family protein [Gammaproteobacteria bacterium]